MSFIANTLNPYKLKFMLYQTAYVFMSQKLIEIKIMNHLRQRFPIHGP
jgi:hypothetical protein